MPMPTKFCLDEKEHRLPEIHPLEPLEGLLPGGGPWEVEVGFGKGRFLLREALENPERRFLGVELVSKYHRMLWTRAQRRGVSNLAVVRGEALYLLATSLPRGFAEVVHVYFPDPWPKSRHHRRRLFDEETVDLVMGLIRPGGRLEFATDFLDYGDRVVEILRGFPGLDVQLLNEPWPDGARTNYEAKFIREGRPIIRLRAYLEATPVDSFRSLHPLGEERVLAAWAPHRE